MSEWAEHNDPEVLDWNRVRSEIEHEDNLTNHRLTWLLTSQGFLFAAFALIFQASTKTDVKPDLVPFYQYVLSGAAITGIISSAFIWFHLREAEIQLRVIDEW